jgi:phosphoesterase RecJ-like protein
MSNDYNEQLAASQEFILKHNEFLVVSHIQPDGDAASSTCAVGWLLSQFNKRFIMVNEGAIPDKFQYLWGSEQVIHAAETPIPLKYKYVICVDCADYSRIGDVADYFADDVQILNIDHHPTNNHYGTVNLIQDDAAATAVLLFDLFEWMNVTWDVDAATCLYTGLLTDTGGFRYANTSPKVMEIASKLLRCGVNANKMAEELLEKLTVSHIHLLKKALNTLSFSPNQKIAWLSISLADMMETEASNGDLEGFVNYPRNIEGVEVGIMFKELEDRKVKVSFRSAGKVDVAHLAQSFGGGGHILASGATLEGSPEEVVSLIVQAVEEVLC